MKVQGPLLVGGGIIISAWHNMVVGHLVEVFVVIESVLISP